MASLHFMKRDNDFMEEDDMFFSKRHSKAADDTGKDIQYFAGPVEFIIFMIQIYLFNRIIFINFKYKKIGNLQ